MKYKSHTDEMRFFNQISNWWDPDGAMAPLHKMNPARLSFLLKHLSEHTSSSGPPSLKGLRILDVGCGGGLITEPLTRLGATLIGLDANPQSIQSARSHAQQLELDIDYRLGQITDLEEYEAFDAVIALEVIEHVDNPSNFITDCFKCLKPGGYFFLSTLNKTYASYLLGIFLAERILKWLPKGTHDWYKFVKPSDVRNFVEANQGKIIELAGLQLNPLTSAWELGKSLEVNFIVAAQKN